MTNESDNEEGGATPSVSSKAATAKTGRSGRCSGWERVVGMMRTRKAFGTQWNHMNQMFFEQKLINEIASSMLLASFAPLGLPKNGAFFRSGGETKQTKHLKPQQEPCEHSCYGKPLSGQPDVSVFVHERLPRLLVETCPNSTVSFWLKLHSHKGKIAMENHGKSTFCRCVSWNS